MVATKGLSPAVRMLVAFVLVAMTALLLFARAYQVPIAKTINYYLDEYIIKPATARQDKVAEPAVKFVKSSIYKIRIERKEAPADAGTGGAIAALGDEIFLLTRLGGLYHLDDERAAFSRLHLEMPAPVVNSKNFYSRPKDIDSLGYNDLLLRRQGGLIEMTVSHAVVDPERECVSLVISQTSLPEDALRRGDAHVEAQWRRVWESKPCLESPLMSFPYQSGGEMVFMPDEKLAVFVGDFGLDVRNRHIPGVGPQHLTDDIGKVVLVDLGSGASKILSRGHRNPGGIFTDRKGNLWVAEHGPQGGDELNLIIEGRNFGWPLESFGTHYGMFVWPPDKTPGTHQRFTLPVFAWVPSIATSSLARFEGGEFPTWDGDLLLGTLNTKSIHRLNLQEGRLVVDEPIFLDVRVRDLTVDSRGRIYVKVDERPEVLVLSNATEPAELAAEMPGPLAACAGCHQVTPGDIAKYAGPSLVGVMGRKVASLPGFAYSAALGNKGGEWTPAALREFIANPSTWAPGTFMPSPEVLEDEIPSIIGALEGLGSGQQ